MRLRIYLVGFFRNIKITAAAGPS